MYMAALSPRRQFLLALRARAARIAITASSMRGPGCGEAIATLRPYVASLDLRPFGTSSTAGFAKALDLVTNTALERMPASCRSWGLARKGLNIYLRECLYTHYLREAYYLHLSEGNFELPMDSLTARKLRAAGNDAAPRWCSVRELDSTENAVFQQLAAQEGSQRGMARIHLDAFWWGLRED
jgi:hypothetical protein